MKFSPSTAIGSSRQGVIRDITAEEIEEIFGFGPNVDDDPYKVVHSWAVDVTDVPFWNDSDPERHTWTVHVWDYKGSHKFRQFSVCGDPDIMHMIFGDRYQCEIGSPFGYARIPTWLEQE